VQPGDRVLEIGTGRANQWVVVLASRSATPSARALRAIEVEPVSVEGGSRL
jgi:hypothetical protein